MKIDHFDVHSTQYEAESLANFGHRFWILIFHGFYFPSFISSQTTMTHGKRLKSTAKKTKYSPQRVNYARLYAVTTTTTAQQQQSFRGKRVLLPDRRRCIVRLILFQSDYIR